MIAQTPYLLHAKNCYDFLLVLYCDFRFNEWNCCQIKSHQIIIPRKKRRTRIMLQDIYRVVFATRCG